MVYNWLQCSHLSNFVGDYFGRRFEYYTVVACLAPAVLLTQLYYFLDTARDGNHSRLLSLNTHIVLSSFVSFVWLILVLLQLAIGIRHNTCREEVIHDM